MKNFFTHQKLDLNPTMFKKCFCPKCKKMVYAFKTYNKFYYPSDQYEVHYVNNKNNLPDLVNDIVYEANEFTFNDECITKKDIGNIGRINGIQNILNRTINNYNLPSNKNVQYASISKYCTLTFGGSNYHTCYSYICPECGFVTTEEESQVIYFLGKKAAGKTTLIYTLLSYFLTSRTSNSKSYDYIYWDAIKADGEYGKIAATNALLSPPLSLNIENNLFSLFDVMGEESAKILGIIKDNSTVIFNVALDIEIETQRLNIKDIETELRRIITYITDLGNEKRIDYFKCFLVFTKCDNLNIGDNKSIFEQDNTISNLISDIEKKIKSSAIFVAAKYNDKTEPLNFSEFAKTTLGIRIPQKNKITETLISKLKSFLGEI